MAICLTGWLEETFATQLLRGNVWLEGKYRRKEGRTESRLGRVGQALYHDNGSCLDITIDIHPEQNSHLQIIQACDRQQCVSACSS
jgi:hypothetical protein